MGSKLNLGRTVARQRKKKGLTQGRLAQKAGISYSTLAKLERGAIAAPSVFTVADIASILDTTVDELINPDNHLIGGSDTNSDNEIKFVFCDVNGVLVRFYHRAFAVLASETGINIERIENAFWHYNDAANRGEISMKEFNSAVEQKLGLSTGAFDWEERYMEVTEPIKSMHECLREISKTTPVGLLSDNFPGFLNKMIERGLLPDINYGAVVESASVGSKKPDAKIYKIAENMAGVKGENIFFIDDSRTNLIAAEKHDWRVLWFDDYRPEESVKKVKEALKTRSSKDPVTS